jgi:hypothetical protein
MAAGDRTLATAQWERAAVTEPWGGGGGPVPMATALDADQQRSFLD